MGTMIYLGWTRLVDALYFPSDNANQWSVKQYNFVPSSREKTVFDLVWLKPASLTTETSFKIKRFACGTFRYDTFQ